MAGLKASPVGFAGNASDLYTTPWPHQLGERARDKQGREYMFVDFGAASLSVGSVVSIDMNHVATALTAASNASRVGVVVAVNPTSLQAGWVQIYGFALVQTQAADQAAASVSEVSATSIVRALVPITAATSPAGGIGLVNVANNSSLEQTSIEIMEILGMWPVLGDAVSDFPGFDGTLSSFDHVVSGAAVTQVSDTSGGVSNTTTGISGALLPVFLNYPYYMNQARLLSGVAS